jgi:hypothetical protein
LTTTAFSFLHGSGTSRHWILLQLASLILWLGQALAAGPELPSEVVQWQIFEGEMRHPDPPTDPLRGVDLHTTFTGPDDSEWTFFGFHDGGTLWRYRFAPEQPGRWRYTARFSDGAVEISGEFQCLPAPPGSPAPLVRWPANPIWFAVAGQADPLAVRSFHVGDRFFAVNFPAERRAEFLTWAREQGYGLLSVASHYLNRDAPGRGRTWATPRLWDQTNRTVLHEEYARLEVLLAEVGRAGFHLFPFAGFIGRTSEAPATPDDRDVYMRYTLARLAPFWNVMFNVAGPEPLWFPEGYRPPLSYAEINRLGEQIARWDPFGRLRTVHNAAGDDPFRFQPWATFATLQGGPAEKSADFVALHHWIFRNHTLDRPLYAQEVLWPGNYLNANLSPDEVRRKALVLLFAGVGAITFADMDGDSSSGYSGTLDPSIRRNEMHTAVREAWSFFDRIPFGSLRPRWGGETGAIWLADDSEYWGYWPASFTAKVPSQLQPGWMGEWHDPQSRTPTLRFTVGEERQLAPPPSFPADAVIRLYRPINLNSTSEP